MLDTALGQLIGDEEFLLRLCVDNVPDDVCGERRIDHFAGRQLRPNEQYWD